jgi:hypothetical protein
MLVVIVHSSSLVQEFALLFSELALLFPEFALLFPPEL